MVDTVKSFCHLTCCSEIRNKFVYSNTAKFVVSRCAKCKLWRDFVLIVFFYSSNHLGGGGVMEITTSCFCSQHFQFFFHPVFVGIASRRRWASALRCVNLVPYSDDWRNRKAQNPFEVCILCILAVILFLNRTTHLRHPGVFFIVSISLFKKGGASHDWLRKQ